MTADEEVWRLGEAVVLQGQAIADTAWLVQVGIRTLKRDSATTHPRWLAIHGKLAAAATGVSPLSDAKGPIERPIDKPLAPWPEDDRISSTEAAKMLDRTDRQIRRSAHRLGGRKIGRNYFFSRSAIEAEVQRRNEREQA